MPSAPEFSSLLVSRPGPVVPLLLRARGYVFAMALYAAGLAVLLATPLFMLEMMKPPEAGLRPLPPTGRLVFHPPALRGGDGLPAAPVRRGVRSGAERGSRDIRPRAPRALAAVSPLEAPPFHPAADPAAPGDPDDPIGAVKEWRYRPALMNDRPVAAYIQVMVEFTLSR